MARTCAKWFWRLPLCAWAQFYTGFVQQSIRDPPLRLMSRPKFSTCITHHLMHETWNFSKRSSGPGRQYPKHNLYGNCLKAYLDSIIPVSKYLVTHSHGNELLTMYHKSFLFYRPREITSWDDPPSKEWKTHLKN